MIDMVIQFLQFSFVTKLQEYKAGRISSIADVSMVIFAFICVAEYASTSWLMLSLIS